MLNAKGLERTSVFVLGGRLSPRAFAISSCAYRPSDAAARQKSASGSVFPNVARHQCRAAPPSATIRLVSRTASTAFAP